MGVSGGRSYGRSCRAVEAAVRWMVREPCNVRPGRASGSHGGVVADVSGIAFGNFSVCVPRETVVEAGVGTLVANLPKAPCCRRC